MIRKVAKLNPMVTETMPDLNSIENALSSLGWNKARIKCLAAALVAILTVHSINLKKIANLFPTDADKKSAYKRLQRFLRFFDPDLDSLAILLARLSKVAPPWNLAMDRTNWKLGRVHLNVFMLCIVEGYIGFPLLWIALEKPEKAKKGKKTDRKREEPNKKVGKAGNTNTKDRIALMSRFVKLFGVRACACLRADREFASREFLLWLEQMGISYQLRLKANTLIANAKGELCCADGLFRDCPIQKERSLGIRMVLDRPRWVTGTRLASGDYLILVSDVSRPLCEYSLRWGIEPMFGAFKSRGFDLEATHVTDPTRLSRLLCLLALAYTWSGTCGLWVFSRVGFKPDGSVKVNKHGRLPVSVFRLGLDFLQPIVAKMCRNIKDCEGEIALKFLSST
jgi:Transposase DDE domain